MEARDGAWGAGEHPGSARASTMRAALGYWSLLAAAWWAAFNLRPAVVGIAPVMPLIRSDLGLSYLETGIILSMPVVVMGLGSLPGSSLVARLGAVRVVSYGLLLVAAGSLARAASTGFGSLLVTTAVLAGGVGLAQPALPVLVKQRYPAHMGLATSIYTSGLIIGATAGAFATAPLLLPWMGPWSWRGTLLFWGGLTLLAWLGWGVINRRAGDNRRGGAVPIRTGSQETEAPAVGLPPGPSGNLWRDPLLWKLSILFAGQSTMFHTFLSWLPTFYEELGWALAEASVPITLLTAMQIPMALFAPAVAERFGWQRPLLVASAALIPTAVAGFMLAPGFAGGSLWGVALGLGIGGVFSLTMALHVALTPPQNTARSAGMIFAVGYAGAATGPTLLGLIRDLSGAFTGGFLTALAAGLALVAVALSTPGKPLEDARPAP